MLFLSCARERKTLCLLFACPHRRERIFLLPPSPYTLTRVSVGEVEEGKEIKENERGERERDFFVSKHWGEKRTNPKTLGFPDYYPTFLPWVKRIGRRPTCAKGFVRSGQLELFRCGPHCSSLCSTCILYHTRSAWPNSFELFWSYRKLGPLARTAQIKDDETSGPYIFLNMLIRRGGQ